MGIVTEHVKINHSVFERIRLNNAAIYFDDIKNIDLNLLTINKRRIKNTNTVVSYEIRYITDWDNIYQKIPICLSFTDLDAYFVEENQNKDLIFALTENNRKEVLEPYKKLWNKIKKNKLRQ